MTHNYYHDTSNIQEQKEFINLNKSINKVNCSMHFNFGVKAIISMITITQNSSNFTIKFIN